MTDRCESSGVRGARRSYEEVSCEPTPEELEAKRQEAAKPSPTDAEERRDAWIAGQSSNSASKGVPSASCDGPGPKERAATEAAERSRQMHLASMRYTATKDRPLEDDPVGNAIPGMVAGGIVGLGRAAAGSALVAPSAKISAQRAGEIAAHEAARVVAKTATHNAEHVAAELALHAAEHGAHAAHAAYAKHERATAEAEGLGSPPVLPPTPHGVASPPAAAGRSSGSGSSEVARDPMEGGKSEPKGPSGSDRLPYLPGRAPARIPEALPAPTAVVVRG